MYFSGQQAAVQHRISPTNSFAVSRFTAIHENIGVVAV
jgi:hypothetical protein